MPERTERVSGGEYEVPAGGPTRVLLEVVISGQVSLWSVWIEGNVVAYPASVYGNSAYCLEVGEPRNEKSPLNVAVGEFVAAASTTWRPTLEVDGSGVARLYSRYV